MKAGNRVAATAFAGALGLAVGGALSAAENVTFPTMRPLMAASFDVGSKHVVSFFRKSGDNCNLTLMIAETADAESALPRELASRLLIAVEPGRAARFDAPEGERLTFACRDGARAPNPG